MTRILFSACAVALAISASPASAATVTLIEDHAVGIERFAFDNVEYDLRFDSRSFDAIVAAYDDPFPFLQFGFDAAQSALEAINVLLEEAGATKVADIDAERAFLRGMIPTLEASLANPAAFIAAETAFFGGDWRLDGAFAPLRSIAAGDRGRAFIVFERAAVAAVPLPASGLLAVAAMAGLAAVGRRRRRS